MGETLAQQWHEVSHLDDLWEGTMEAVEVQGKPVLLINLDGEVFAYQNRCPHQAWPLDQGYLDDEELTCANHMWVFDVSTGKGINPENCSLVSYQCKVDDSGAVLVCVE